MEKEKYSIIITLLCLCMAMGGCSKEEVAADTATGTLTLQLQLPPALTVEVGESKGRAAISLADIQINNVWAVQYDASGNFRKSQYISEENNIVKNDDSQYLVRVNTSGFFNEDSRFYILVNTGNGSLITEQGITEADLKQLTVDLTDGVLASAVPVFLTAGPISFKKLAEQDGQKVDKAIITAPLSRPYAALKFTYNSKNPEKGKFVPTSLSLGNLPTKMTVHADGNRNITDFTSSEQSLTITGWTSGGSLNSVYIGENLRGFGSGKTFQEKNLNGKGPGPNGSLDKCTYAVLTGTYYYCTGVDASNNYTYTTNGITVSYKFYLGGSLLDDYNIIRNTLYTVTINIGGANSADIRLTVTNGNVSYFDEVEEVQPDYEVIL